MKTKEDKELLQRLKEGEALMVDTFKDKLSDKGLYKKIRKVYEGSVLAPTNKFVSKGKSENYCSYFSGMTIDIASKNVANTLNQYAMNPSSSEYEIPFDSACKLKKYYKHILLENITKDKAINKLFGLYFQVSCVDAMISAMKYRQVVLAEKAKMKKSKIYDKKRI